MTDILQVIESSTTDLPYSRRVVKENVSDSNSNRYPSRSREFGWHSLPPESETEGSNFTPFKPDERDFNTVISRISNLLQDEDIRPTQYALNTALSLVYETNQLLKGIFARASTAVDEDGSIFIYWRNPERTIELRIPAQRQGRYHIYHREGSSYGFERNVTASTLAAWIKWFMRV